MKENVLPCILKQNSLIGVLYKYVMYFLNSRKHMGGLCYSVPHVSVQHMNKFMEIH